MFNFEWWILNLVLNFLVIPSLTFIIYHLIFLEVPILITGWILVFFWLLAIYSVSIYESFNISLKLVHSWAMSDPSNYFYFFRQLKNLLIWLVAAFIVYKTPLEFIQKNRNKIFIWFFLFQLLVFTPLWTELNWATWWLYFKWLWTVQPSEFFKMAFVIFFAWWLLKKKDVLSQPKWFIAFLFITWLFFFVFLQIPDLGTILVLWLVTLIMYWYAWGRLSYIVWLLWVWLILWVTVWMQFDYVKKRLEHFVNPEIDASWKWVGWQIQQALISVWGWGFLGNGYGKWLQKFGYIPEAQSDFIFAAFSEEIWLLWNSVLLTLYFLLAYFFLRKLPTVKNEYYRILWVWTLAIIMMQTFVNMWVNIKLLPLTWLTLPFVSFGWTALMINFIELVVLYKIIENK